MKKETLKILYYIALIASTIQLVIDIRRFDIDKWEILDLLGILTWIFFAFVMIINIRDLTRSKSDN